MKFIYLVLCAQMSTQVLVATQKNVHRIEREEKEREQKQKTEKKSVAEQLFALAYNCDEQDIDIACLETLLKNNTENLDALRDEKGNTALMLFLSCYEPEDYDEPPQLITRGTNGAWDMDAKTFPPNLKSIYLILRAGADANARNYDAMTPLLIAARHADSNLIHLLLAYGADITAQSSEQKTILDYAPITSPYFTTQLSHLGAPMNYSQVPLFMNAVLVGDIPLVRDFLQHGMNIEAQDPLLRNETALIIACAENHSLPMIKELLAHGADVNHLVDGVHALWAHFFCIEREQCHHHSDLAVVKLLIDAGSNVNIQHPTDHKTMLMLIIESFIQNPQQPLDAETLEIIKALVLGNKQYGPTNFLLADQNGMTLKDYLTVNIPADSPEVINVKTAMITQLILLAPNQWRENWYLKSTSPEAA